MSLCKINVLSFILKLLKMSLELSRCEKLLSTTAHFNPQLRKDIKKKKNICLTCSNDFNFGFSHKLLITAGVRRANNPTNSWASDGVKSSHPKTCFLPRPADSYTTIYEAKKRKKRKKITPLNSRVVFADTASYLGRRSWTFWYICDCNDFPTVHDRWAGWKSHRQEETIIIISVKW